MALKGAALVTDSVGSLSHALESGGNFVAAVVSVRVTARARDADHHFGHGKTAHGLADRFEADIDSALPYTETFIHVEPADNSVR